MKLRFYLMLASTLAGASTLLGAQAAPAPDGSSPKLVANVITSEQMRDAILQSKALFKKGDFANGRAALFSANRHPPGTAEGHRDSGTSLMRMAFAFRQDGDGVTATKLAELALDELNEARVAAGSNSRLTADIYTRIGLICERLCGTRQQAESNYSLALQISPTTAKAAASALQTLRAGDATLAVRAATAAGK